MNPYIITHPVITEKSLQLVQQTNTYTFKVQRTATKTQVSTAIEQLYGVEVTSVRTIVNQARSQRTGRRRMKALGAKVKKALVTLKAGNKIELFETAPAA